MVTLGGSLTVYQIEDEAASLKTVFLDKKAFPGGVVGVKTDSNGELVVLSAGVGDDRRWEISRASWVVVE